MAETNPNKVNQYTDPDPRQALFLASYLNPESETFANAYRSAVKAGYEDSYAVNIMSALPEWLSESIETSHIVSIAEKNLKNLLLTGEEKTQADMTKFALSRLNKKKYSERQEITGKDGKDLPAPILGGIFVQENNSDQQGVADEGKD